MGKPTFTHAELKSALHYDPATGVFTWRSERGKGAARKKAGDVAGCPDKDGYTRLKFCGSDLRAGRVAWFYMHAVWPDRQIDHINGNRTDDRFSNLRLATASQNTANQAKRSGTSSRLKGAVWNKAARRWQATVKSNGRTIYLGLFETEEQAAEAYAAAATIVHGEFARAG